MRPVRARPGGSPTPCGVIGRPILAAAAVLALVLLISSAGPAHALQPTPAFYVNDYVGVLSRAEVDYLVHRGEQLHRLNGVQVVAVIVDNYIGDSLVAYANRVFNEFGIGTKGVNNGVLLIVAVDDGEVRIEVGDGLSAQLPDSKAGTILDEHFLPPALEGDLAGAVYQTYLVLVREGSRLDTKPPAGGGNRRWLGLVFPVLLILVGIALLIWAARRTNRSYPPRPVAGPQRGGGAPPTAWPGYPGGPPSRLPSGPVMRTPHRRPWLGLPPTVWDPRPTPSTRQPTSPTRHSHGGGGRSAGGGASRGFPPSGSAGRTGGRPAGGGFSSGGRSASGGAGRSSGVVGRSSGGGASRGFKR